MMFLLAWFALGVLAAGWFYAHRQRKWPEFADGERDRDTKYALCLVCYGPVAVIAVLLDGNFHHGWLLPGRKP